MKSNTRRSTYNEMWRKNTFSEELLNKQLLSLYNKFVFKTFKIFNRKIVKNISTSKLRLVCILTQYYANIVLIGNAFNEIIKIDSTIII